MGRIPDNPVTPAAERRALRALLAAFLRMDLRGQHYAKATATRPRHVISPLFWVVGQCLTVSAVASLVLFMRVDAWFYAFVHLSLSMLVIATAVLVEFHEVVLHPEDLEIVGPRPVSPRAYTAARFMNLLFYVGLMYAALNVMPLMLGTALRDSGLAFAPAYLLASLCGNLSTVCVVVLLLAAAGNSPRWEQWKEILAWTQIVLILVLGYGAQLMFRDSKHALEVWGAFPPDWVQYLPSTWLARFVDEAVVGPTDQTWLAAAAMTGMSVTACALTYRRLCGLYRAMQPRAVAGRTIHTARNALGTLRRRGWGWLVRRPAERTGFYLCAAMLRRDAALRMRCLMPLNALPAAVVLGIATGQFANPLLEREPRLVMLSMLAVYALALAVPVLIYHLAFSDEHEAAWLFQTAPLERPIDVAVGMCKAVQALLVTPLCLLLGLVLWAAWGDPKSAALHAGLAWSLCWPAAMASLAVVLPSFPLSLPQSRGASLGPIALPLAAVSGVLGLVAMAHYALADEPWFYVAAGGAALAAGWPLARWAAPRLAAFAREGG